jgi:hypothetical protein
MKATLTFDKEDELMDAVNGYKYKLALWDLNQFLRSEIKHADLPTEEHYYAEKVREKLYDLINDYNLNLD